MKKVSILLWLISTPFYISVCFSYSPDDQKIYDRLQQEIRLKGDVPSVKIARLGNKTIQMEVFVSAEAENKLAVEILSNFGRYAAWVLPGINDRPKNKGGQYYVQILNILNEGPDQLLIQLRLAVPLFDQPFQRKFLMNIQKSIEIFTVNGRADPLEHSVVEQASGYLKLFPAKADRTRLWIYTHGIVQLRPWLLYEAFPTRAVEREAGERIATIVQNYQKEESRLLEIRSNQIPIYRKEAGGE